MSGRRKRRKARRLLYSTSNVKPSLPPGTLISTADAVPSTIEFIGYNPTEFVELTLDSVEDVKNHLAKWNVSWINVDGLGDTNVVAKLGQLLKLHELALEDVLSVSQRAKAEQYGDELFIIMRMIASTDPLETEQLSMFLGKNFVLTFQERPGGDCLNHIRERIRKSYGLIRTERADYLAYAIIDAVIDGYFPVLEEMGDRLDTLEDEILEKAAQDTPAKIHEIKRDILALRRAIWPIRDAVNTLVRDSNPRISEKTRLYLRDCHDHSVRVMDLVETYRETGADLMDLYLTSVSNKLNEVMKVLTIITVLFIPPTFIAGVYGMNFNPQKSPWNMPELEWYYGYPFALGLMLIAMVGLGWYLYSRGWMKPAEPAGTANSPSSSTTSHSHAQAAREISDAQ